MKIVVLIATMLLDGANEFTPSQIEEITVEKHTVSSQLYLRSQICSEL